MSLTPQFLDELRARTTLSTLIGRTLTIKRAGREWKACCPIHNEKTPSFTINDEKGFWHCFGCSAHGDAIRWLTDQRGLSFMDAVKELAAEAGMEVPASDPQAAARAKTRDASLEINARALRFFSGRLDAREGDTDASAAVLYLSNRGIDGHAIAKFDIGYAPDSRPGKGAPLKEALSTVAPAELEKLGLIKRNKDSGTVYDFFRRRIIIPIHDPRGGVIGFGGRIVGAGEPKYLNSPDTPVFDKGRSLFNMHRAAAPARAKDRLLIVEGYMDVIGLDSVGFDTAVAPNGTALTEQQLFLAWRLVDTPTVCFDADNAGRKAAYRAAYRALPVMEPGKGLRFATLPDGKDPDDLAREQGLEAVNAMVEAALPLVDIIWRDLTERYDMKNPDKRAAMSVDIKRLLASIRNGDVREAYTLALRERFGAAGKRSSATGGRPVRAGNVALAVEAALLLGLVDMPEAIDQCGRAVSSFPWKTEDHAHLATVLYDAGENGPINRQQAIEAIERAGMTEFVSQLRRGALRMPFATETNPARAHDMLVAAIRDNFA
jgi:DNA primase